MQCLAVLRNGENSALMRLESKRANKTFVFSTKVVRLLIHVQFRGSIQDTDTQKYIACTEEILSDLPSTVVWET